MVPPNRNSPRISCPSSTFSAASSTAGDATKGLVKAKKFRLHPTPEQAKVLRMWVEGARWTYNEALRLVHRSGRKCNLGLKKLVVTSRDTDSEKIRGMKFKVHSHIRKRAVADLVDANKTAWALFKARVKRKEKWRKSSGKNRRNGGGRRRWRKRKPFNLQYKSRSSKSDSFGMEKKDLHIDKDGEVRPFLPDGEMSGGGGRGC